MNESVNESLKLYWVGLGLNPILHIGKHLARGGSKARTRRSREQSSKGKQKGEKVVEGSHG